MYNICSKVGCNKLVKKPGRYCDAHKTVEQENKKENNRYYDKNIRDRKADAFYHSDEWRKTRTSVLIRDNYLCTRCLADGVLKKAEVVHHIVELKDDWSKRLKIDNLESLCDSCHNKHHKK